MLAQYITHIGSMLFQCWAGLLVMLGQRWPNVAHIGPTLVKCWPNVLGKLAIHWANVGPTRWDNIGPMSKIILGQHHLPTFAQCNWLHWSNVGPTLACYLGSDLKCRENHQNDEHIPHKTQKCKGIHTTFQVEITEIDNLYPADLQKCWKLILVSLIFF